MIDLRENIRTARVGSRGLDADLYEALGYEVKRVPENRDGVAWKYFNEDSRRWTSMAHLTTNIEHALRLTPPGLAIAILVYPDGRASAVLGAAHGSPPTPQMGQILATPALAVCCACIGQAQWGRRL